MREAYLLPGSSQFIVGAPGGVLVPALSCPLLSTHQQWPVDPWHCCGLYWPSSSHWGMKAPVRGTSPSLLRRLSLCCSHWVLGCTGYRWDTQGIVIPPLHSFAQPFVYMKWKGLCKFKSCQTLNSNKVIICFDHNIADVNIAHVNTGGFNKPRPSLKSYIFPKRNAIQYVYNNKGASLHIFMLSFLNSG